MSRPLLIILGMQGALVEDSLHCLGLMWLFAVGLGATAIARRSRSAPPSV